MFDWAYTEIHRAEVLVQGVIALIGIGTVAYTYVKTKAVVPTVGALIFAFFVVWAIHNASWFDQKIGDEFHDSMTGVVLPVRR